MKRFLFMFAFVVSLLLPCVKNVYAASSTDDSQNYLSYVEGYSQEEIYNFLRDYISSKNFNLDSYPYVYFLDRSDFVESNDLNTSSYLLFLSSGPAIYNSSSKCLRFKDVNFVEVSIYSSSGNGKIFYNYNTAFNYNYVDLSYSQEYLVYSNYEVFNGDTLFMPKMSFPRPQIILGMEKTVLSQVVAQENPLKEILTILPMVIPCWVGFVALRKALRLLATILRTA